MTQDIGKPVKESIFIFVFMKPENDDLPEYNQYHNDN